MPVAVDTRIDARAYADSSFIVVDAQITIRYARDQARTVGASTLVIIKQTHSDSYIEPEYFVVSLWQTTSWLSAALLDSPLSDVLDLLGAMRAQAIKQGSLGEQTLRLIQSSCLVVLDHDRVVSLLWRGIDGKLIEPRLLPNDRRFISAELEDHDQFTPLQVGRKYTLAFGVSVMTSSEGESTPREGTVEITVQLFSDDFHVYSEPQRLYVLASGTSTNKARFEIEPRHASVGEINAILLKDGNFIQLMIIKIQTVASNEEDAFTAVNTVDAVDDSGLSTLGSSQPKTFTTTSSQPTAIAPNEPITRIIPIGPPANSMWIIGPRHLNLIITPLDPFHFKLYVTGAVYGWADLKITPQALEQYIDDARKALEKVVELEYPIHSGNKPHKASIDIHPDVNKEALKILADAGYTLFQHLFYDYHDPRAEKLGDSVRKVAKSETLRIQINSEEFRLPWGLLYIADKFDENNIDPELFLGFKHIIEQKPLDPGHEIPLPKIDSGNDLVVSLNVDYSINLPIGRGRHFIDDQVDYWNSLYNLGLLPQPITRKRNSDILQDLINMYQMRDRFMYFNCHAQAASPPNDSWIKLSDDLPMTLKDLERQAPARVNQPPLPGRPLVFLNACESAKLSPLFYNGFIPYLFAKGARGAIGTESNIPTVFAVEWAKRFFTAFLDSAPLGELFLNLRRDFYYNHNNVLGLLYAVYCDSDTYLDPPIRQIPSLPRISLSHEQ